jgi:acetyl-CoA acetyltransferase family protein
MPELRDVYICDAVRTPFGRYGGALSSVRADDLAALPIQALRERHADVDWAELDDVIYGCANQAGEDNRNVGRMALLLAGLPESVPGATVNRLCGSSMDAFAQAARAIRAGEMDLVIAGGVESMSRAPFVMSKADGAFARNLTFEDTTLGWRFVNPRMRQAFGIDSMAETAENVAAEYGVSRQDQDAFALRSQQRTAAAVAAGRFRLGDRARARRAEEGHRPGLDRRAPARRHDARGAGEADADRQARRHRDGGQRVRHQ